MLFNLPIIPYYIRGMVPSPDSAADLLAADPATSIPSVPPPIVWRIVSPSPSSQNQSGSCNIPRSLSPSGWAVRPAGPPRTASAGDNCAHRCRCFPGIDDQVGREWPAPPHSPSCTVLRQPRRPSIAPLPVFSPLLPHKTSPNFPGKLHPLLFGFFWWGTGPDSYENSFRMG